MRNNFNNVQTPEYQEVYNPWVRNKIITGNRAQVQKWVKSP